MVKSVIMEEGTYDIKDVIDLVTQNTRVIGKGKVVLKTTLSPCILGVWGGENLVCEKCGEIQVKNIQRFQIENISIICPECNTQNDY